MAGKVTSVYVDDNLLDLYDLFCENYVQQQRSIYKDKWIVEVPTISRVLVHGARAYMQDYLNCTLDLFENEN